MNQLARLIGQTFPAFDIQVSIPQECFVQRQHQQSTLQGSTHSGETRCCNFLKDRHQESKSSALATLAAREVKAILQVLTQLLVEQSLFLAHQEGFGMHPAARKQW